MKASMPDHALLKGIGFTIPALIVAWLYVRDKSTARIYYVILSLVIARIGLNIFYLPTLSQQTRAAANQKHVEKLFEITGDKGFYLSGKPYRQETTISFGPLGKMTSEITTAPMLSYIIPYYYSLKTEQVLLFKEDKAAGNYYLLNITDIGAEKVDTLYTFQDSWTKDELALVRIK
jgi:hypothetical protein